MGSKWFSYGIFVLMWLVSITSAWTLDTRQMADRWSEGKAYLEESERLRSEGKNIKADALKEKAGKIVMELFQPNKVYTVSPECPIEKTGINFRLTCPQAEGIVFFTVRKSTIPILIENKGIRFYPKNLKSYVTDDKIGARVEDMTKAFVGKIQIGGLFPIQNAVIIKIISAQELGIAPVADATVSNGVAEEECKKIQIGWSESNVQELLGASALQADFKENGFMWQYFGKDNLNSCRIIFDIGRLVKSINWGASEGPE